MHLYNCLKWKDFERKIRIKVDKNRNFSFISLMKCCTEYFLKNFIIYNLNYVGSKWNKSLTADNLTNYLNTSEKYDNKHAQNVLYFDTCTMTLYTVHKNSCALTVFLWKYAKSIRVKMAKEQFSQITIKQNIWKI